MATIINNPKNAMQGLQFAIGGGTVPWSQSQFAGGTPNYTPKPYAGRPGAGAPAPAPMSYAAGVSTDAMGNAQPPRIATDGMRPAGAARPGAGGPADLAKLQEEVKTLKLGPGTGQQARPQATVTRNFGSAGAPGGGMAAGRAAMSGLSRSTRGVY